MQISGRIALAASLALALTACGKKDETPAAVASDTAAASDAAAAPAATALPAAGAYEVSDAEGKRLGTTTIYAGGTYADDKADGHRVAGLVKMKDGKVCFDPSGKAPEECYTDSTPGADGSFTATDAKGAVLTIKPKAK